MDKVKADLYVAGRVTIEAMQMNDINKTAAIRLWANFSGVGTQALDARVSDTLPTPSLEEVKEPQPPIQSIREGAAAVGGTAQQPQPQKRRARGPNGRGFTLVTEEKVVLWLIIFGVAFILSCFVS